MTWRQDTKESPGLIRTINAGLIIGMAAGLGACDRESAPESMNIIYILADDLGYGDLGCMGQQKIKTPNIDRLAAQGMLFTQHYAGSTVSAPSRSCLLTGLHSGHTPIRGNKEVEDEGQAPLPAGTYTIATMFREAGYKTGAFGKWGLGYPGSEGDPLNQGFDRFFGYNCQRWAHRYYPAHLWDDNRKITLDANMGGQREVYAPDLIHTKALEFIASNRDNPFFLFLPYVQPHAELIAPQDDIIDMYRGLFPETPHRDAYTNDYGQDMSPDGYCSQAEPHATFASMVTRLDRYVGEIVERLKSLGLEKNTIIMFTSDNGPHIEGGADPEFFGGSGPLRGTKRDLYEGGIRVPLIVWAPGTVPSGTVSEHICAFWDMMPTFADMAGHTLPERVRTDGLSFYPTITGKKAPAEHDSLYWEFHEHNGRQAVRLGGWKGIKENLFTDSNTKIKLFDLSSDIHEDNDIAREHPDIVARIEKIMQESHIESPAFPFDSRIAK